MKQIFILLPFLVFISCDSADSLEDDDMQPKITLEEKKEADKLLEIHCFTCHAPTETNPRLGPPIYDVVNHYYNESITEKEFVESIVDYAANPSVDKSRMPEAIEEFGLMPQSNFETSDLQKIAKYLFYGDFKKSQAIEKPSNADSVNYMEIGKTAAMEVKSVLGKNLFSALDNLGTVGAVDFCNTKAIVLTDSVSLAIDTKVRRVSDKPRNTDNQANSEELEILKSMQGLLVKGENIIPQIVVKNSKVVGYYPIMTNAMCLQCHGTPKNNIEVQTLEKIVSLYPKDKAIGYSENELRGLFVVEMDKL